MGAIGVQLHAVSYKYPHSDRVALSEIYYTFSRGTTAIVGSNGAGKSTLVKLLTGLLEPTSGWIRIRLPGGEYLPPEELQKAVLFQEPSHLYLTIRQNITMRFDTTPGEDARIYGALEKAGLGQVVKGLPDGIDTVVGAGFGGQTDLSGGQWQRLALARLIYQDAPMIILDEPVASLDPEGERAVFELFSRLARSRIIIFTTHRYDSIPKNTKIVVLVDGHIAESGMHEELLQHRRDYWSLYMGEDSNRTMPVYASVADQADHAKHAMNGRTALNLPGPAPRTDVLSQDSASLSVFLAEPEALFAYLASTNGRVISRPERIFSRDKSSAHSTANLPSPDSAPSQVPVPSPVARRGLRKRSVLLLSLLALLLTAALGTGLFLLLQAERAPNTAHLVTTTAKASPTPTQSPSLYPSFAASYAGTVSDLMTAEHTVLYLANIQQNQGHFHGFFRGLGLASSFTGTVTTSGQVQFTLNINDGTMTVVFEGNIKVGGDIVGTFSIVNQQGQRTGEYGLWNVSPSQ